MAIPVEHEDVEELAKWGMGLEKLVERCVFCDNKTRYWHKKSNNPVCPICAKTHSLAELKAKATPMTTNTEQLKPRWLVQVFGEKCSKSWEISVVRSDNKHGQQSWGWFGDDKLLVSHNGGPCDWPICEFVWDRQIQIAYDLCAELNRRTTGEHHDN